MSFDLKMSMLTDEYVSHHFSLPQYTMSFRSSLGLKEWGPGVDLGFYLAGPSPSLGLGQVSGSLFGFFKFQLEFLIIPHVLLLLFSR